MSSRAGSVIRATFLACLCAVLQGGSRASAQVSPVTFDRNELTFSRSTLDFGPPGLLTFARYKLFFFEGTFDFRTGAFAFPQSAIVFPVGPERVETPATIEVVLPTDLVFDYARSDVATAAETELNDLAEIIRYNPVCPVTIQAFTDTPPPDGRERSLPGKSWLESIEDSIGDKLGADSSNKRVSEQVAQSVRLWLETHAGLPPARLNTAGLGSRDPVLPNTHPDGSDDPDGRKSNRRIKFIIPKFPGVAGRCA